MCRFLYIWEQMTPEADIQHLTSLVPLRFCGSAGAFLQQTQGTSRDYILTSTMSHNGTRANTSVGSIRHQVEVYGIITRPGFTLVTSQWAASSQSTSNHQHLTTQIKSSKRTIHNISYFCLFWKLFFKCFICQIVQALSVKAYKVPALTLSEVLSSFSSIEVAWGRVPVQHRQLQPHTLLVLPHLHQQITLF